MSMCRVFSCVVGRGCLLWPVHSLGKTRLVFALLHSAFQGKFACYSRCFLTSYFWENFFCAAAGKLLQSCLTLYDPRDGIPPGSPVPGILQARTLKWVAISFSNAWKWKVKVKLLSRVWLSDPMDCSLPGSSVHRIFQARVLECWAVTNSA